MTETEREAIGVAVDKLDKALDRFMSLTRNGAELHELYDAAKPVHTEALGIWCTIVEILRTHNGLDKPSQIDELNLEELFS